MKLIYKKPLIFPKRGIFSGKDAGKTNYRLEDDCVVFSPEKDKLPHHNHIEMTGFEASSIISYKVDAQKRLQLYSFCVFPQIRVIPNETGGSLSRRFQNAELCFENAKAEVTEIRFDGILQIKEQAGNADICRRHLDGRAWKNDPDVFLLRDQNNKMTFAERKLLAKINSTFGNLLFISDNVSEYTPEQLAVLKDTFANKDVTIQSAEFIKTDVMKTAYTENGTPHTLCFHIRTGEILENK